MRYFRRCVAMVGFLSIILSALYGSDEKKIINKIMVEGNSLVSTDAIIKRLLYKEGDFFDQDKSAQALEKVYRLGYFSNLSLEKDETEHGIDLFLKVTEKKLLSRYLISGNFHMSTKKLADKLNLKKQEAVDSSDVDYFCALIKKFYQEENYHKTTVTGRLEQEADSENSVTLHLDIQEGPVSQVRQIHFVGANRVPEWRLRESLLSKELWLLAFMDGAGRFNREMIEADKQRIETVYQDHGFLRAKVIEAKIDRIEGDESQVQLTFHINEGDRYTVRYVMLPYDDEITKEEFMHALVLKEDDLYSRSAVQATMERIRMLLGKKGYIYADVYPVPKINDETKKVDFTFMIEKGEKVKVRRINITGNKSTRDKVIRREIALEEGALVTTPALDISKRRIEALGYFDRSGVNWKMHKLSEGLVDLELNVKEVKTGFFFLDMGIGGREGRLGSGAQIGLNVGKRNLGGRGWDAMMQLRSEGQRMGHFSTSFSNPYLLDSNISLAVEGFHKVDEYEQWGASNRHPIERITGFNIGIGFRIPKFDKDVHFLCELGLEKNSFANANELVFRGRNSFILNERLRTGVHTWLGTSITKDTRNHRVYPSQGYNFIARSKLAIPAFNSTFSFLKLEARASWYTALIGEDDLVLAVQGKLGAVDALSSRYIVPHRELYHMGGHDTIRGFVVGGAGPVLVPDFELRERGNTPLGARRCMLFNVELQFPLLHAYGMKGRVFYDAGGGWNTPMDGIPDDAKPYVKRNDFNVRHSVGFGISMLRPQPIKVDWGYKLDRDKQFKESDWEMHLSMNIPW